MIFNLKSKIIIYDILTNEESHVMREEVAFNFSDDVLDEIQQNIQDIIENFDVPEDNKLDVIRKINFMYSRTKELSITDALTGLYNRRHFEASADREFLRAVRYKNNLTFAIIDIDFFKKINDTYGHLCGDKILKDVAFIINDSFRKTDMVFRYGGEEFVVILTETDSQGAQIPLERLRERIANSEFTFKTQKLNVTISIGYASNLNDAEDAVELFSFADDALYKAKESGRNRILNYKE